MQKLRKKAGLLASDALDVYIGSCSSETRDSNASSGSGSSSAAGSREQHAAPPASAAAAAAPDISRVLESQVRGAACFRPLACLKRLPPEPQCQHEALHISCH